MTTQGLAKALLLCSIMLCNVVSFGAVETTKMDVSLTTGTTVTVTSVEPVTYLRSILPSLPAPNAAVVKTLLEYPRDGTHAYWWPKGGGYDGATSDVMVGPLVALKGEPEKRTFCCGLTLEVFYRTLPPETVSEKLQTGLADFKKNWFCREIFSPGPEDALKAFGLGSKIEELGKALPGDFVQLWRNNRSGHSVIFINWVVDAGNKVVGMQYWSTQPKTGIDFNTEYFGDQPKMMDVSKISIARVSPAP